MPIEIVPVSDKRKMREFINFPFKLYRNDEMWIPPLIYQERSQFNPEKNPAFDYCDACFFLARDEGSTVEIGRAHV